MSFLPGLWPAPPPPAASLDTAELEAALQSALHDELCDLEELEAAAMPSQTPSAGEPMSVTASRLAADQIAADDRADEEYQEARRAAIADGEYQTGDYGPGPMPFASLALRDPAASASGEGSPASTAALKRHGLRLGASRLLHLCSTRAGPPATPRATPTLSGAGALPRGRGPLASLPQPELLSTDLPHPPPPWQPNPPRTRLPTRASLRVATLNLQSLTHDAKLDLVLAECEHRHIDILLGQETWHSNSTSLTYPEGWTQVSAPHPTIPGRRGLIILANRATLDRLGLHLHLLQSESLASHDFLAASLGPWTLISVYVPPGQRCNYSHLATNLAGLRPTPSSPVIIGGDFNHPRRHHVLSQRLSAVLDASPVLQPPSITRPSTDGSGGSLLDNIYLAGTGLTGPMPRPAVINMLTNHDGTGRISDHCAVIITLPAPAAPGQAPPSHGRRLPPRRPSSAPIPRRIRWAQVRLLPPPLPPTDGLIPPTAVQPDTPDSRGRLLTNRISQRIRALPPAADLAQLNAALLQIASEELGTYRPRPGMRHPYMSRPEVKAALKARHHAIKRLARARQRRSPRLPQAQAAVNAASRAFTSARDAAIRAYTVDQLSRLSHNPSKFFRRFQPARGAKTASGRSNPLLQPAPTARFWQGVYTSKAGDDGNIADWEPYVPTITMAITDKQARAAVQAMTPKCSGPDGMDFRFIKHFLDDLAPRLSAAFTQALHGLPAAMRTGLTLLFPKNLKSPTTNPADYRPITLLPVLVRIFQKTLDMLFRAGMEAKPGRAPLLCLRRPQAGFLPRRNGHEQALVLHVIQAINRESYATANKVLHAAFLDIQKAFDSMEHPHILNILAARKRFPRQWLEILRRILPGNSTTILGAEIIFTRGLPQGGALSPFLCLVVMDDLARHIERFLAGRPDITSTWRSRRGPASANPWHLPDLARLWVALLLFADDVTVLALDPLHLRDLLAAIHAWGQLNHLIFSPKSFAALLSGPRNQPQPQLAFGPSNLRWQPAGQALSYLGVPTATHALATRNWRAPLDTDRLDNGRSTTSRLPCLCLSV